MKVVGRSARRLFPDDMAFAFVVEDREEGQPVLDSIFNDGCIHQCAVMIAALTRTMAMAGGFPLDDFLDQIKAEVYGKGLRTFRGQRFPNKGGTE